MHMLPLTECGENAGSYSLGLTGRLEFSRADSKSGTCFHLSPRRILLTVLSETLKQAAISRSLWNGHSSGPRMIFTSSSLSFAPGLSFPRR